MVTVAGAGVTQNLIAGNYVGLNAAGTAALFNVQDGISVFGLDATATTKIGRSSYSFLQAVFHEGECAAIANATMVMIDAATRRARTLPEDVVARLQRLRLRAAAL